MQHVLISVLDVKLGQFNTPNAFPNRAVASRSIKDVCSQVDNDFAKHPEDYQFYVVGYFDSDSGLTQTVSPPELFFSAADFVS